MTRVSIPDSTLTRDPAKGLRRTGTLARTGRIPPVSAKRRRENRERRAMITATFGSGQPLCAVWLLIQPEWCTQWADDAHEPLTRARRGSITDPGNCRPLCRTCHDMVTFRPESEIPWAYQFGILRHSWLCCQGRTVCSQYSGEAA